MTGRFTLSPRAQADVEEIWGYTARQWGTDQAETYVRRIAEQVGFLAEQPMLGSPCDEVRAGYFWFPCEQHMLFYRMVGGGVEIVRILHKRMDFRRHL